MIQGLAYFSVLQVFHSILIMIVLNVLKITYFKINYFTGLLCINIIQTTLILSMWIFKT